MLSYHTIRKLDDTIITFEKHLKSKFVGWKRAI